MNPSKTSINEVGMKDLGIEEEDSSFGLNPVVVNDDRTNFTAYPELTFSKQSKLGSALKKNMKPFIKQFIGKWSPFNKHAVT